MFCTLWALCSGASANLQYSLFRQVQPLRSWCSAWNLLLFAVGPPAHLWAARLTEGNRLVPHDFCMSSVEPSWVGWPSPIDTRFRQEGPHSLHLPLLRHLAMHCCEGKHSLWEATRCVESVSVPSRLTGFDFRRVRVGICSTGVWQVGRETLSLTRWLVWQVLASSYMSHHP